jgi:WD40 repeat protein
VWKRFTGAQPFSSVAYHPKGRLLAAATFDNLAKPGEVYLWDVPSGKLVSTFRGHEGWVTGLSWSSDGTRLASCGHDGTVRILDGETLKETLVFRERGVPVAAAAFSPDDKRIASAAGRLEARKARDSQVVIWRAKTREVLHRLTGHTGRMTTLAFSPDGQRLVSGGRDGQVKLWDVETGQEVLSLDGDEGEVWSVAFSRAGTIASGGTAGVIRVWHGGR